ncbi:hypothetical protein TYRP_001744 [Tyrophagus putrescentiae]|nr:hypothetical protein TYRP_001744 [Tyrophagus putrescentiae]
MRTQSTQTEPLNGAVLGPQAATSLTTSPNLSGDQQLQHQQQHAQGHRREHYHPHPRPYPPKQYPYQQQQLHTSASATFLSSSGGVTSCCPASVVHEVDHSLFFTDEAKTPTSAAGAAFPSSSAGAKSGRSRSRRSSKSNRVDDDDGEIENESRSHQNTGYDDGADNNNNNNNSSSRDPRTPSYPSYASGGHMHQHQFVIRTIPSYLTLSPRASYHRLNIKHRYPPPPVNDGSRRANADQTAASSDLYADMITGDTIMLCCFPDDLLYDGLPGHLNQEQAEQNNSSLDERDSITLTPPTSSNALRYAENLSWAILNDLEDGGRGGHSADNIPFPPPPPPLPPPKMHMYKSCSEHGILDLANSGTSSGPSVIINNSSRYLAPRMLYGTRNRNENGNGRREGCSSTRATYSGSSADEAAAIGDGGDGNGSNSSSENSSSYGIPPPPPPLHTDQYLRNSEAQLLISNSNDKQLQTAWSQSLEQMLDLNTAEQQQQHHQQPYYLENDNDDDEFYKQQQQHHQQQLSLPSQYASSSKSSGNYHHHHSYQYHSEHLRPKSAEVYGECGSSLPPPPFFHHPSFSESELYVQFTKENYNSAQELNRRHSAIADLAIVDTLGFYAGNDEEDGENERALMMMGVQPPPPLPPPPHHSSHNLPPPLNLTTGLLDLGLEPLPLELAALQSVIATPPPGFEDTADDDDGTQVDRFFAANAAAARRSLTTASGTSSGASNTITTTPTNIVSPESELSTSQVTSVTNCSELLATTGTTFSSDMTTTTPGLGSLTTGGGGGGGGVSNGENGGGGGGDRKTLTLLDPQNECIVFPGGVNPFPLSDSASASTAAAAKPTIMQQNSSSISSTSGGRFIGGRYTLDFDDDDGEGDGDDDDGEEEEEEEADEGDDVYDVEGGADADEEELDDDEFDDGCRLGPVNRIRIHPHRPSSSGVGSSSSLAASSAYRPIPAVWLELPLEQQQQSALGTSSSYAANVADYAVAEGSSQDEEEKAKYEVEFETEEEEYGVDEEELQLDLAKEGVSTSTFSLPQPLKPKRPSELELVSVPKPSDTKRVPSSTLLYYHKKPAHFPPSPPPPPTNIDGKQLNLAFASDPPKEDEVEQSSLSSSSSRPQMLAAINPALTPSGSGGRVSSKSLPENLYSCCTADEEEEGGEPRSGRLFYRGHPHPQHHHPHHHQGHQNAKGTEECPLEHSSRSGHHHAHFSGGGRLTRAKSNTLGRLSGIRMTVPLSSNLSEIFFLPGTKHLREQYLQQQEEGKGHGYGVDPRDLTPVQDGIYSSDPSTTLELTSTANTVVEKEFDDGEFDKNDDEEEEEEDEGE